MPIYDRKCPDGHEMLECYERINADNPPCKECGKETKRVILTTNRRNVLSDDIPGGLEIRHGLCNEDGTPRRYYSKSEIAKEAAKRGLVNYVEHVPELGSDKSRHTVRWASAPVITEEERLKHWYETEKEYAKDGTSVSQGSAVQTEAKE